MGTLNLNTKKSKFSTTLSPPKEQMHALLNLYNAGRFRELIANTETLINQYPSSFTLWNILGAGNKALTLLPEAEKAFRQAIKLNRSYADAHSNLGFTLQEQGKLDEAITAYRRALKINPTHADAHNNIGNALKRKGKLNEAITAYRRALKINPTFTYAIYNIGTAFHQQGKLDEAIAAYQRALKSNPAFAEAYNNIAGALYEQGKLDEAIAAYRNALKIKPSFAAAEAQMLYCQQHICDFTISKKLYDASSRLGIATEAVPPFGSLSWADEPKHQLLRAIRSSREQYKERVLSLPARANVRPKHLRIGYLSADFHDHATMYLISGLLREHDRNSFTIFAYSYGREKSGNWRKQTENDVDHFFDVCNQSDQEIVNLVRSHKLDIAIDLKGYTQNTRSQIFQYRLAPIQVNYLGYPGSMGADFIDYIIADPVVIPADQRQFYSEKIIYLPHSYQANDNKRAISSSNTHRSDFNLPEDALVFCCFNNNYKISAVEFDIWMRLLHEIEGSVLWLLRSNKWAESNLRNEAAKRGIDPLRLIFAPKICHSEHLARHKHADLFLDTFNYNAHTTASDALWSGLPVVTKQGKQFAARVAASLLKAVGLAELITETDQQYEELIIELAKNSMKLNTIKENLLKNREKFPLFDTRLYTRNFEKGLMEAYDIYHSELAPADIWVPFDD